MLSTDRIPARIVLVAAALSLAPFLAITWALWDLSRLVPEVREQSLAVQELIGRIDHLDEALTASARLGASTGDLRWETRYLEHEREVYRAIDSLGILTRAVGQPAVAEGIGAVADSLATLEHRAFDLVRAGEADAAWELLESPAYTGAKAAYQERKARLLGGLSAWVAAAQERTDERIRQVVLLAAASLLILLVVWGVSTVLVRRRTEERRKVEEQLRRRVAEQARLEAEVREAEERLRAIVEVAPVAIVRVDRDRIVQFWNPAAERIFGWSAEEVLGRPYPITGPRHRAEADRLFAQGFEGESLSGVELRRHRKDGSEIHVRLWNAPVFSEEGEVRALVGVFVDVTEQRELERRLRQAEKLEAIGRLAGGVAHDFNNVMTAIRGYTDILLQDVPADDPLRGDVEEIRRNVGRATNLTSQLLAFSRRQVLEPRVLDPAAVVRELRPMLERLLGEDVRLEVRVDDELGRVEVDPTRLEQVVVNLVVNARDAMPGGGTVSVGLENARIIGSETEHLDEEVTPGSYVRIVVADTGEGMDEDTRQRIFEPFFTTKRNGGTGLGLATVFGIVKQSGGTIRVESQPGEGTRFEILLKSVEG